MPPSRALAGQVGVARNTIIAVYDELVARGYLVSTQRRGYFVENDAGGLAVNENVAGAPARAQPARPERFAIAPAPTRPIPTPTTRPASPSPFIYSPPAR